MYDDNKDMMYLIVLVLSIGLIAVGIMAASGTEEKEGIFVSGSATTTAAPDQAEVNIGIVTRGNTAKEVEDDNAMVMSDVIAALKKTGLSDSEIETISFNVYPVYDYDESPAEIDRYRATHTLKVTTENIDVIGDIVDAATDAGANEIGNVQFTLSKEAQEDLRISLLGDASNDAREKADAVAQGLNVKVGKPISVTVDVGYSPFRVYAESAVDEIEMSTQVQPGDVEFTVTIQVEYQIK